jgi:hypothetical protein
MSDTSSPLPKLALRMIQRPRCPRCQTRVAVQRIVPGRPGFEHWTLRCASCGNIHEAQVHTDPMKSETRGWLASELAPPH